MRSRRPHTALRVRLTRAFAAGMAVVPTDVAVFVYLNLRTDLRASVSLVIAALVLIRILAAQAWNAEIIPVAIAGMIVAIAYNPSFAMMVEQASVASPVCTGATAGPDLVLDPNGPLSLVTQSAGAGATERFWQVLTDPTTYARR